MKYFASLFAWSIMTLTVTAQSPSGELNPLRKNYEASERLVRELAAQLQAKPDDQPLADRLRRQVAKSFSLRQTLHEAELNAAQQKLDRSRKAFQQRRRNHAGQNQHG